MAKLLYSLSNADNDQVRKRIVAKKFFLGEQSEGVEAGTGHVVLSLKPINELRRRVKGCHSRT